MLTTGILVTGSALTVALRRLDYERMPQAAMLAAMVFVASLITVPLGPSSVHLLFNGLMGLVLGWAAVPALLVTLLLQAVFFGYGGIVVLGVNAMNLLLPALICALLLQPRLRRANSAAAAARIGALAGLLGVGLSAGLISLALALSDPALQPAARLVLISYLPLMLVEALISGAMLSFVYRVSPELLFQPRVGDNG